MAIVNQDWAASVREEISEKVTEFKQVALAGRLEKELETLSLEQLLANHLPASDSGQIQAAAGDIEHAVDEMYTGLNEKVTDNWMEAELNRVLADRDPDKQGRSLVNILRSFEKANMYALQEATDWEELREKETFQEQDVARLLPLAINCMGQGAGFMVRQEFEVMENTLSSLPYTVVEAQMNSGPRYAVAYAAAMYIQQKQSQPAEDEALPTPYQLGLLAANAVESSRILAQYHFGKIRLEEAVPDLLALKRRLLTFAATALLQTAAFGLRLFESAVLAKVTLLLLMSAGVTSTTALWAAPLLMATLIFLNCPQQEAVDELVRVWNGVKGLVSRLIEKVTDPHKEEKAFLLKTIEEASPLVEEDEEEEEPYVENTPLVTV